jgi:hypothetical protein
MFDISTAPKLLGGALPQRIDVGFRPTYIICAFLGEARPCCRALG